MPQTEQLQPQINVGRDSNQAPNGSIKTENSGNGNNNKLLWWMLGIVGTVVATVIGAKLLNIFNLQ